MFSLIDQTLVLQILRRGFESAMAESGSSGIDSVTRCQVRTVRVKYFCVF